MGGLKFLMGGGGGEGWGERGVGEDLVSRH